MDITVQPPTSQEVKDNEHLRLLSIFHYVVGGLAIVFSCFFLFHIFIGLMMLSDPGFFGNQTNNAPPRFLGMLFVVLPLLMILFSWALGAVTIYSGVCLKHRKHRLYSLIVAGINCLNMPLGTALGIFTILVLMRDSVKRDYEMRMQAS